MSIFLILFLIIFICNGTVKNPNLLRRHLRFILEHRIIGLLVSREQISSKTALKDALSRKHIPQLNETTHEEFFVSKNYSSSPMFKVVKNHNGFMFLPTTRLFLVHHLSNRANTNN